MGPVCGYWVMVFERTVALQRCNVVTCSAMKHNENGTSQMNVPLVLNRYTASSLGSMFNPVLIGAVSRFSAFLME
jgi:hypothetical protein